MQEHPLRLWRKDSGLTLDELAARAGVAGATLSRLERRLFNPSLDLVARLVRITNGAVDANAFLPPGIELGRSSMEAAE